MDFSTKALFKSYGVIVGKVPFIFSQYVHFCNTPSVCANVASEPSD